MRGAPSEMAMIAAMNNRRATESECNTRVIIDLQPGFGHGNCSLPRE